MTRAVNLQRMVITEIICGRVTLFFIVVIVVVVFVVVVVVVVTVVIVVPLKQHHPPPQKASQQLSFRFIHVFETFSKQKRCSGGCSSF